MAKAIAKAKADDIPMSYIFRVLQMYEQGFKEADFKTYDTDYNSDAYLTVSGQNSNNSVRVPNKFFQAVQNDEDWNLINRKDGQFAKPLKHAHYGIKFHMQLGQVPIQAHNMMIRLMNGIHVLKTDASMHQIHVQNICS